MRMITIIMGGPTSLLDILALDMGYYFLPFFAFSAKDRIASTFFSPNSP